MDRFDPVKHERSLQFVELRKLAYQKWMDTHPEGITQENNNEYQEFMRREAP